MPSYDDPLWTIIAFAIVALVAVWATIHNQPRRTKNRSNGQDNEEHGDVPATPGFQYEERNPRAIAPLDRWTAVLAVATVFAAIFGAFTLSAIRGQLEEMRTDRRAWVTADIAVFEDLDYNVNGINVSLLFELRNTGKTPATSVVPYITATPFPIYANSALADQCNHSAHGGISIFPGDKRRMPAGTTIPKEVIDELWQKYPNFRPAIRPDLFVCIIYRMPGDPVDHHTPFVFNLRRKTSLISGRFPSVIYVDEGRVEADNLELFDETLIFGRAPD